MHNLVKIWKLVLLRCLPILFLGLILRPGFCAASGPERPWVTDVIYFALLDRFLDGNPHNNVPKGSDPNLFDRGRKNIDLYHGGDLAGLGLALENNYFTNLGVTAIWITPPVKNAWWSVPEKKSGYCGYWAQDFLDIDPHWTSGATGHDCASRRARIKEYKSFIELAHQKGIKVIQDIVVNHIGPLFYYDVNDNGVFDIHLFDDNSYTEWIQPYKKDGYYDRARWAHVPEWNLVQPQPARSFACVDGCLEVETKGILQNLAIYGRKGWSQTSLGKTNGEEIECDFLANRDIWSKSESCFFDELVDEFVEIYRYYLSLGVDGFRVDTVKHVDKEFWDSFIVKLRKKLNEVENRKLLIFGEVYSGDPGVLGQYTYRTSTTQGSAPLFDSLLNFQFCYAIRNYLRVKNTDNGSPRDLLQMIYDLNYGKDNGRYYFNLERGPDGICSRQKMINFIGNHDGLNRFLVKGVKARNNRLALGLVMTMEGIPCIYYGSECDLVTEGEIDRDSESGRVSFLKADWDNCTEGDYRLTFKQAAGSSTYRFIKQLSDYRRTLTSLQYGRVKAIYPNPDAFKEPEASFVFMRYLDKDTQVDKNQEVVVVAVNADPRSEKKISGLKLLDIDNAPILFDGNPTMQVLTLGEDMASGQANLQCGEQGLYEINLCLPPESLSLFLIGQQ